MLAYYGSEEGQMLYFAPMPSSGNILVGLRAPGGYWKLKMIPPGESGLEDRPGVVIRFKPESPRTEET